MSLSTPQVLVGEEEEGSAYVDPLITLQDPMFAMLNSGDGMPAHHRRYPPTAVSIQSPIWVGLGSHSPPRA